MIRETINALIACVLTFALCAVVYPATVWVLAQLAFPSHAEGSLLYRGDRTVLGSELIAQSFTSAAYFHSRPSAVDYNASATGGSNLSPTNPTLREQMAERAQALGATDAHPVPPDMVTASGSGIDPHIRPESARYQAARVAVARGLPVDRVLNLIETHVDRSGAIVGAPERVHVLRLNLALDALTEAD